MATLTAALMIGSVGPALTGVAGAVPAAAGGIIVTVMDATQALGLDPSSGLDGLAALWVGGGRVAFFGHRISGGTIRFGGEITVRSGARTARLTDLTLDIGTGTVDATLDSQPLRLATMDTDNLRLRKNPGDKNLYLGIGFGEDSRAVLTSDGAAALNSALAIGTLEQGLPLLGGTISVGLAVDERVAAEVNTDAPALIENGVVVDIGLDERIDLSDDLGRG